MSSSLSPEEPKELEPILRLTKELYEREKLPLKGIYEISKKQIKTQNEQKIWNEYVNFLTGPLRGARREGIRVIDAFIEYERIKDSEDVKDQIEKMAADIHMNAARTEIKTYVMGLKERLEQAGYKKKGFF